MDPLILIAENYGTDSSAHAILVAHSHAVADKAVKLASRVSHLKPDVSFIHESAMLHDIGIAATDSPTLGCYGNRPYVCHGVFGRRILEDAGLSAHAMVCERHVGAGISKEEIIRRSLPLPARDMIPVSIEEIIVCYADKFFSKSGDDPEGEKPLEEVIGTIKKYGNGQLFRFVRWAKMFGDL